MLAMKFSPARIRPPLLCFALLLVQVSLFAQVPQLLHYQGRVIISNTNFEGTGLFKFALVNGAGNVSYWSNDGTSTTGNQPTAGVSLLVAKGLYAVLLGDTNLANMTAVSPAVFANADVRLRVWFNDGATGYQLVSPDQRIASVGYAMTAAGLLNNTIASQFLRVNGAGGEAAYLGGDGAAGDVELGSLNPAVSSVSLYNPVSGRPMNLSVGGIVVDAYDQNPGSLETNALRFSYGGGEGIASKRTSGGNQYGLDLFTGFAPRLSISLDGNVGIGTNSPQSKLHVAGTVTATTLSGRGAVPWAQTSLETFEAIPNHGYLVNSTGQTAISLSTNSAIGDVIRIADVGLGGWKVTQQAGQHIRTIGVEGYLKQVTPRDAARNWRDLAMSADGRKMAAVVEDGQIYVSSDFGITWTPRESNRNWRGIAMSANGKQLVAVARNETIYISNDGGITWSPRESSRTWQAVASSADGQNLVALVSGGQIYTSTDYGDNWLPRESNRVWWCVASSADGSKLVAGVLAGTGTKFGHIYTSSDFGVNWIERGDDVGWPSVATSADGSRVIAASARSYGDYGGVYVSTDSFATATQYLVQKYFGGVACSADGRCLVAGNDSHGVFVSSDYGANWSNPGLVLNAGRAAMSADGSVVALLGEPVSQSPFQQIYTSTSAQGTQRGIGGALVGSPDATVELLYLGGGNFRVLSHEGNVQSVVLSPP